jgi:hypothetical protein
MCHCLSIDRQVERLLRVAEQTCLQDVSMSWNTQARAEMLDNHQGISISTNAVDY